MARILVVEDDGDLRFLYDKALALQGYEVSVARNTSEAIIYLTSDDYDAVILDMNMPDAPGTRVLEFRHQDVRLRHIPVLVVSANEKYRIQARDLGAAYYLVKPVPLEDLTRVLKAALAAP